MSLPVENSAPAVGRREAFPFGNFTMIPKKLLAADVSVEDFFSDATVMEAIYALYVRNNSLTKEEREYFEGCIKKGLAEAANKAYERLHTQ
jgi:hypothetical protein